MPDNMGSAGAPAPVSARRPWSDLPLTVIPPLTTLVTEVLGPLVHTIPEAVPELVADDVTHSLDADLARGIDLGVRCFLAAIGHDQPALSREAEEFFEHVGSSEATHGVPITNVLNAHRAAHRLVVNAIFEQGPHLGMTTPELIAISDSVFVFIDELAAATTRGYSQQAHVQAGAMDQRRRHLAQLMIQGAEAQAVESAARHAGWTLPQRARAVVVPPDVIHDLLASLDPSVLHHEREGTGVLVVPEGADGRELLARRLSGHRATCGPLLPVSAVSASLAIADAVAAIAGQSIPDNAVTPLFAEDHLTQVVLTGRPEARAALAEELLAPLDSVRATSRERLLDTLAVWLHHWGQRTIVAEVLGVHPQTIGYRLTQLRALFGPALESSDTRFALAVALHDRLAGIEPETDDAAESTTVEA